jgi:hypothetical protein
MSLLSEFNSSGIVALSSLYFFRSITDDEADRTIHVCVCTIKRQQTPKQKQHGLSTALTLLIRNDET